MYEIIALVLAGGRDNSLDPLTRTRSKGAVPFAGKYRIADIPISNCLNSNVEHIFVLTHYNSFSLNRHLHRTYNYISFREGFVEAVTIEDDTRNERGTNDSADSIRKMFPYFKRNRPKYVLVIPGDQICQIDINQMKLKHMANDDTDLTLAVTPVANVHAEDSVIVSTPDDSRITSFKPDPVDREDLDSMSREDGTVLVSMGIYLFNFQTLEEALVREGSSLSHDIIPQMVDSYNVKAFEFGGYWEDLKSIQAYYEANLDQTGPKPALTLYNESRPTFTRSRYLPPSTIIDSRLNQTLISDGAIIKGARISRSVIGSRAVIDEGTTIENSIILGADFYTIGSRAKGDDMSSRPPLGIGRDCKIRRAIIDKNVSIGDRVIIENRERLDEAREELFHIHDGIVVIPSETVIPDETVI